VTLSGYTVATFTTQAQQAFTNAVSMTLSVDPSAVVITGVSASARRHLLSGVAVAFTVTTTTPATSLTSQFSILQSSNVFSSALASSFIDQGLPVPTAGRVTATPPVGTPGAPAATHLV